MQTTLIPNTPDYFANQNEMYSTVEEAERFYREINEPPQHQSQTPNLNLYRSYMTEPVQPEEYYPRVQQHIQENDGNNTDTTVTYDSHADTEVIFVIDIDED